MSCGLIDDDLFTFELKMTPSIEKKSAKTANLQAPCMKECYDALVTEIKRGNIITHKLRFTFICKNSILATVYWRIYTAS